MVNHRHALLLLSLLAGCSSGGGKVTACAIVPRADVEAALGKAVGEGVARAGAAEDITTCDYRAVDGNASVKVRVSPKIGDREHAWFPFRNAQAVPGLGDGTKFAANAAIDDEMARMDLGSALSTLKGNVEISIFYRGDGDRLVVSKALAAKALSRL